MTSGHVTSPGAPPAGAASRGAAPRRLGTILSGLGWNTGGQVVTTALNVLATPFLLVHLGVDRYGVVAFASTLRGLLSNLDGGFGPCASRYFAVYGGAGDRRRSSQLLVTASLLVLAASLPVLAAVVLAAPGLADLLHASAGLRASATELLRLFAVLLLVSNVRMMLTRLVSAEHRWAFLSVTNTLGTSVYLVSAVLLVWRGAGVIGMFWASVAQEAVLLALSLAAARSYLRPGALRLLPRAEVAGIVRFASRVQVAAVASSVGNEFSSLLVAAVLPVRFVAYYSIGSNFAGQLAALPVNALGPITVTLARTFGSRGLHGTVQELERLQRLWVRAIAAWPVAGAVAAYFGVRAWLGPSEGLAGAVAAVLLAGQCVTLLGLVMDSFTKAVDEPGLESRYLALGNGMGMALAVPLVLTVGLLGVPIGMSVGGVVATLYLLVLARRRIAASLPSFIAEVPVAPTLIAGAVTSVGELALSPLGVRGALGLLLCAVPAGLGLASYLAAVHGPRQVWRELASRRR